jgi:hypothetical protein
VIFEAIPTPVASSPTCCQALRALLLGSLIFSLATAKSLGAHPQSENPIFAGQPQIADSTGLSYYAHARPYLKDSQRHLVKQIPELRTLRPSRDQKALPMILRQVGAREEEFFHNVVDLFADETIAQEVYEPPGTVLASQQTRYGYLILLNDHEIPPKYDEYRTDPQGNPTQPIGFEQGYAITAGFALKCIYFLPDLQPEITYRYLGDQMMGSRDTYVVAFAQRPAHATFWGTVLSEGGKVVILDQGIAWVDKNTFQIIRIRTDLLAPHIELGLAQQTTEITFSEVQIPDMSRALWLPETANVYALFQGQAFRNEHRYQNYQHFHVSVKMRQPSIQLSSRIPDSP